MNNTISNTPQTSQDIVDSINNYLAIINNDKALQTLFSQGNYFLYDSSSAYITKETINVHAYPGIFNDELYFFMLPDNYDNPDSMGDLITYTQCCPIEKPKGNGTNIIPSPVAQQRIENWALHFQDWIPLQVASEYGMFKAFKISKEDFESANDEIYLALAENPETSAGFDADLIVANFNKTAAAVVYDDYVKSVPPFDTAMEQESFYLLTQ